MSTPARIAIFSDLHLTMSPSERNRVFLELLRSFGGPSTSTLAPTSELWLLGDIFDLLIGSYSFWAETHREIFGELSRLATEGTRVLWIEGNHDFHFGAGIGDERLDVSVGPVVRKVAGKRVFLSHGDLVNIEDRAYLRWRSFVRSGIFRFVMHSLPGSLAERFLVPLGERLSHESRLRDRYDPALREMYLDYARSRWSEGFDGVCMGHCHLAERAVEGTKFYFNMGSWVGGSFHYGSWDPESEAAPALVPARPS